MHFSKIKKVMATFVGTIVEYYDYSLYGFSAGIIASNFFSTTIHPLTALTKVFEIYAIAYVAKPLGALLFGSLGDYFGRKNALKISIIGIALPTVIIGCMPGYASIGMWASVLLLVCRFLQSIFVAGEYDGAALYVLEHFGKKFRYTASAVTRFSGVVGLLLGICATNLFSSQYVPEWAWRIPFLLSGPLALLAFYGRQFLEETPDFLKAKKRPPLALGTLLKEQKTLLCAAILLAGGFGVSYQIAVIFMKHYLVMVLPETQSVISLFSVLLVFCFGICMPLCGLLADLFGKEKIFKGALGISVISGLLLMVSIQHHVVWLALVSCIGVAMGVAPFNGLAHAVMFDRFEIRSRYRSISLGHTIGSMFMSGSCNYVCSLCMAFWPLFPIAYLLVFAGLAYGMTLFFSSKTAKESVIKEMPKGILVS